MADAPYIIPDFRRCICLKLRRQRINRTGKHKVLPYDQSHFVAQIIEKVIGIVSASPDADHIKITVPAVFQKRLCPFPADAAADAVLRYVIRSHGKNLHTIHFMGKLIPILIRRRIDRHRSESNLSAPAVLNLSVYSHHDFCLV